VGQVSLQWQIWTFHCVFELGGDSFYVCETKVAIERGVFWFPPYHRNGERHLARTIYPSREKPQTRYTTIIRDQTFILVIYFALKIKLITFLTERSIISPLRNEGQFTTHVMKIQI